MNTTATPRRIKIGFAVIVLLSILLGLYAVWQIRSINGNVVTLATNSVPSVVALNKIIQINATAAKSVQNLIRALGASRQASTEEAAFNAAKTTGDELCREYASLLSDAEDARLFGDAKAARDAYFTAAVQAIELARDQKAAEAEASMIERVGPLLDRTIDSFNKDIDYNISLAAKESQAAGGKVFWSLYSILPLLAGVAVVGGLIGLSTARHTKATLESIDDAIQAGIDETNNTLASISESLQQGADQTAASSSQLTSASRSLANGCSEQGASVTETSASLEEISAMIRATADNAMRAKEFANEARTAAEIGKQTMSEMTVAMQSIETSSHDISKIVKNIDEIAFQTNILALNAAVEAARAGEAGAGFAVVADEVRSLAQRSAAAAKETADKIEAAIVSTQRGSKSCGSVGDALHEIVSKVTEADVLVAEIASAAKEQSQGIKQVGVAMAQMDKVTQGNASSAEQTSSAAEELNSQAILLRETVDQLRQLIRSTSRSGGKEHDAAARPSRRVPQSPVRPTVRLRSGERRGSIGHRQDPSIVMPEERPGAAEGDDSHFRNF